MSKTLKSRRAVRRYLTKRFHWWRTWLGLRWWSVTITWIDSRKEARRFRKKHRCEKECLAVAFPQWEYLQANIVFFTRDLVGLTKERVEKILVHELCHLMVDEMECADTKHEERAVTTLADAFMWVRDQAAEEAGKK